MSFVSSTYSQFLSGLGITALTSVFSFIGGMLLGVLAAVCRQSAIRTLRAIGTIYVEVIRNTPALVQIFIVYFGLPTIGIQIPAIVAGVIALAINGGAYLTEIIRAGIQAVPAGQLEAARSLGLNPFTTFVSVVLPQSIRLVYPPVINEFIQLTLATSLLSTISVVELTQVASIVNGTTFETIKAFSFALVFYLILTSIISALSEVFSRLAFRPPLQKPTAARRARGSWSRLLVAGGKG